MRSQPRGRVLVLERTPRGPAARALARAGFELTPVTTAADAGRAVEAAAFDAVIVDLDDPNVDGVSLIRRMHERATAPAMVWLSSKPTNELAATAAELGVVQLLQKPANARALSRVVSLAVTRTRNLFSMLQAMTRSSSAPHSVTATSAKNEFGSVLEAALHDGAVIITKHDAPRAVLVSIDRVSELLERHEPDLDALSREFDDLVARMQTSKGRAAARQLFSAAPSDFGKAAVAVAKKHG